MEALSGLQDAQPGSVLLARVRAAARRRRAAVEARSGAAGQAPPQAEGGSAARTGCLSPRFASFAETPWAEFDPRGFRRQRPPSPQQASSQMGLDKVRIHVLF